MDAVEESAASVDGEAALGVNEVVLEADDEEGLVGLEVGLVLGDEV